MNINPKVIGYFLCITAIAFALCDELVAAGTAPQQTQPSENEEESSVTEPAQQASKRDQPGAAVSDARKAFDLAVAQNEEMTGAIAHFVEAEGLESAWTAIQSLEGKQRIWADRGWFVVAIPLDLEMAAEKLRAYLGGMVEPQSPEEKFRAGYVRKVTKDSVTELVTEWSKIDRTGAEAFALSLEPGVYRVSAIGALLANMMQSIEASSNFPDGTEEEKFEFLKPALREVLGDAFKRWKLTEGEMKEFKHHG